MRFLSLVLIVSLLPVTSANAQGFIEQLLSANCDAVTLGECGRKRNKKQAEVDEANAQAAYKAALAQHNQKLNDLQAAIDGKVKDIQDWQSIIEKSPDIDKSLDELITNAQKAFDQKQRSQSILGRIFSMGEKSSRDAEIIREQILKVSLETANSAGTGENQTKTSLVTIWQKHMDVLTQIAESRQRDLRSYIDDAIASANGPALSNLISDVTIVRSYVQSLFKKIEAQIQLRSNELDDLRVQYNTATTEPLPPPHATTSADEDSGHGEEAMQRVQQQQWLRTGMGRD